VQKREGSTDILAHRFEGVQVGTSQYDPPTSARKWVAIRSVFTCCANDILSLAFSTVIPNYESPICGDHHWGRMRVRALLDERCGLSEQQITWDPEADRRIRRSPFLMRRFIRKRIEERVASRGRTHVTEADVDESASMYRQYRFK
jgi:hypothetical protein